jgi:hypothetical protein
MLEGQCFCGFVRYGTEGGPYNVTNCHCSICRRLSGAAFVTWFSVPVATFRFLTNEPTTIRSSKHGRRTFCPRCGPPWIRLCGGLPAFAERRPPSPTQ